MKKIFIIIVVTGLFTTKSFTQNVGIGTTVPIALLHVADSSVLFSAADNVTDAPGSLMFTDTTRVMLWRASKAAFRSGYMDSNCLYPNYTGLYSFASGYLANASANYATAFGISSIASGEASAAFGYSSEANGINCMAFGFGSKAYPTSSFASGATCLAAENSTAMGYLSSASASSGSAFSGGKSSQDYCTALGPVQVRQQYGTAMGKNATVFGNALVGTAIGDSGVSNGWYSTAIGHATWSPSYACLTLGRWNTQFETSSTSAWVSTDPVMIVGGGTGNTSTTRADIFKLFKNGNLTISGTLTQSSDERLKENITSLDNSLQKINTLSGYNYYWKSELADSEMQSGVLAQEVEKQMPELVIQNTNDEKAVNYGALIPHLIEAIKELSKQATDADALTAEYNALKAHHDKLVKRVEALEEKSSKKIVWAK